MLRTVRVALPIPVEKEYTYELPGALEAISRHRLPGVGSGARTCLYGNRD